MRILLTGGSGQLGAALRPVLGRLGDLMTPSRDELDLGRAESVEAGLAAMRPDLVINAGAYTDVDGAEAEQAIAVAVNAEAPAVIGRWAARAGSVVIHVSTDYVFDAEGPEPLTEDHPPAPANVYGRTKLAGEEALRRSGAHAVILRTAWLYGPGGVNFFRRVLAWARDRERISVVSDQTGSPTTTLWLADAIGDVVAGLRGIDSSALAGRLGIFHAAGAGAITRNGFAQEIVSQAAHAGWSLACREVVAARSADFPTPARRPGFSALSSARLERVWKIRPQPWQQGLRAVIAASSPNTGRG